MNQQDFSGVKPGDKLWNIQLGECIIASVYPSGMFWCENENGTREEYYPNGNYCKNDKHPSLFWSNPNIQIPERPKRKVKKEINGWVNIYKYYDSKKSADFSAAYHRIDCIKLTGTYEIEE